MANMAPQTTYQGSRGMKRINARSKRAVLPKADRKRDRTIAGKHKKMRVTQTPIPGGDLA